MKIVANFLADAPFFMGEFLIRDFYFTGTCFFWRKKGGVNASGLETCSLGRSDGLAVRHFDSSVLNKVPEVFSCLRAQGAGTFLLTAPQR